MGELEKKEQLESLIKSIEEKITVIENYVFENKKNKYVALKRFVNYVNRFINSTKPLFEVAIEDNEFVTETLDVYGRMLDRLNALDNAYKDDTVEVILYSDGSYLTVSPDEKDELLSNIKEDESGEDTIQANFGDSIDIDAMNSLFTQNPAPTEENVTKTV